MFKNNFLDLVSRVHWSTPLVLYIPFTAFLLYRAFAVYQMPILTVLALMAGGVLSWTLAEYVLHRFVFHWQPPGKIGERIHFVAHGVHHDYPNDSKRLVMPPALSIPLCITFYLLFRVTMGDMYTMGFMPGYVLGYLAYDMTHYALHHVNWKHPFFLALKEHHMVHHYHDPDNGYGVSSKLWDHIFRTNFKITKKDRTVAK